MLKNKMTRHAARATLGLVVVAVVAVGGPGCRKPRQVAVVVTPRPTETPTTVPAVRPAAALWIDGVSYRFPAATLVLSPQSEGMSATLSSDDPPAVLHTDYRGNSFSIQMKLDITSIDDLDTYVWKSVADTTADVDNSTGIFLDGTARQLQPTAPAVTFHKRGDDWIADLDGQFQSLDSVNPDAQRKPSGVNGRLYMLVVSRQ